MEMDEVVVLRLVSGSRVASTKAERLEATRQLTERGYSIVVIASRLHTTPRSVSRYRAELHRREVAA
jgi:DNA-binding NarL/FixJ family response regulator